MTMIASPKWSQISGNPYGHLDAYGKGSAMLPSAFGDFAANYQKGAALMDYSAAMDKRDKDKMAWEAEQNRLNRLSNEKINADNKIWQDRMERAISQKQQSDYETNFNNYMDSRTPQQYRETMNAEVFTPEYKDMAIRNGTNPKDIESLQRNTLEAEQGFQNSQKMKSLLKDYNSKSWFGKANSIILGNLGFDTTAGELHTLARKRGLN